MQIDFPSSKYSYQAVDLFNASKQLLKHFGDHRLLPFDSRNFSFREDVSYLGALSLHHIEFEGGVAINDCQPQGHFLIHLLLKGGVEIHQGRDKDTVCAGQAFIFGPDKAPSLTMPKGGCLLLVRIPADVLSQHARQLIQLSPQQPLRFDQWTLSGKSVEHFIEMASLLHRQLIEKQQQNNLALWEKQAEQFLLSEVLLAFENSYSDWLNNPSPELKSGIVRTVRAYMDSHIAAPIALADLCGAASVSKRSLLYAFKEYCGTSPMKYLQALRLDGLRGDLKNAGQGMTVTEVAFKWGLNNPGRLPKYYKERFGELPSETLAKRNR
jgi:AraC-like DNA-binding protein